MTEVRFEGVVDAYDYSRCGETFPSIGGRDVILLVNQTFPPKTEVKVTLAIEPEPSEFIGELMAEHGWAGTEVTPGDPPEFRVGSRDVLEHLYKFDDREVILIVEPA